MAEELVSRQELIAAIPRGILTYAEPSKEQEKLAKKAQRVLGYGGLLTFTAGGRLQAALEMSEIEVLDPKAVFEYQIRFGRTHLSKSIEFISGPDRDEEEEEDSSASAFDEDIQTPRRGSLVGTGHLWSRVTIANYPKAIPEFVVRKAIQIKEALPAVKIFVEELIKDPDPFLVVQYQGENYIEEYYVEVWEEPEFEGRFVKSTR